MTNGLATKLSRLRETIAPLGRVVVAFSGGVDSALVLKTAADVLQTNALGVLAVSPSLPESEKHEAVQLAKSIGAQLELIETRETEDPQYQANAPNRCFHCKDHVYAALRSFAEARDILHLLDGMNADDTFDLRPGRAAAIKHGVRSPLYELGFSKTEVRQAARALGLANWNKPAAACLSSRIPYGTTVTSNLLQRIEQAEKFLCSLGFSALRARHHGDLVRLEVPLSEFHLLMQQRKMIAGKLKSLGWVYITFDAEGLRHGSANDVLRSDPPAHASSNKAIAVAVDASLAPRP